MKGKNEKRTKNECEFAENKIKLVSSCGYWHYDFPCRHFVYDVSTKSFSSKKYDSQFSTGKCQYCCHLFSQRFRFISQFTFRYCCYSTATLCYICLLSNRLLQQLSRHWYDCRYSPQWCCSYYCHCWKKNPLASPFDQWWLRIHPSFLIDSIVSLYWNWLLSVCSLALIWRFKEKVTRSTNNSKT